MWFRANGQFVDVPHAYCVDVEHSFGVETAYQSDKYALKVDTQAGPVWSRDLAFEDVEELRFYDDTSALICKVNFVRNHA